MKSRVIKLCLVLFTMLFISVSAFAQKTVTGTVVDNYGEPIIGANVVVKGSQEGTITDADGNFSLKNVSDNATLKVSFMGYMVQEVSVAGKSTINFTLEEDSQMLDEVVMVGYGVQRKSDVTGALTRVGAEEINVRPVANALEALQGKAAGVDITTSERPGTIGTIRIRGERSLNGGNEPLYVVDGVPLMSASGIETLNPRDIESIDILKDASATAIYGSRGANGVVLVTTKQGKSGQTSVNYTGTLTISNIKDRSESMSAAEFVQFARWAAHNANPASYADPLNPTQAEDRALFEGEYGALDPTSVANIMNGWSGGKWDPSKVKNTDWTDYVTQTAVSQEHTLSVSGGTEKMSAYASVGYLTEKGTQKGQWYDRYTGKLSVNIDPTKWFSMQASINATWSERDYGMSGTGARSGSGPDAIYGMAKQIYSWAVPYDENGNLIINPGGENGIYNVLDEWNHSQQKAQTMRALGNFSATINAGEIWAPLEGLRYKIAFGPDFRFNREGVYIDGYSVHKVNADGSEGVNQSSLSNRRDFSWTFDNMITYDRSFDIHRVGLTLLHTASKWDTETSNMSANNLEKDSYLWNAFNTVNVNDTDQKVKVGSGITQRQLESYMIRMNYNFDERYMLTVSGRWDGASQLAEGNKWDFFPSAALAWRAGEEEFVKQVDWISNLKARIGVGVTGNAAVAPYATIGDITSFYVPFNGMGDALAYSTNEPYYMANQLTMANKDLGWEKTTQWNIGVDFGFLNSRIFGTIDYYWSNTDDVIMFTNIPTLTGFPGTYSNVGKTKNHGIEVTINAVPVRINGFEWNTDFNIAYQKDEVVELAYGKNDMPDNSLFIGEALSVYYGYGNDGIWQESDADEMAKWNANGYNFTAGNVRPHDVNGDHKMDIEDRTVLGNKNPTTTLGWNNRFTWKGIDLSFSMIGRMGYTFSTGGEAMTAHANQRKVDYWTPKNTGAEWQKPILSQATSGSKDNFSTLLGFKDAGFIKMRNISLGYNFSKKLLKPTSLSHAKVYAQMVNPFSIYQSIDGYDLDTRNTYYNRSFVIGLEVGF